MMTGDEWLKPDRTISTKGNLIYYCIPLLEYQGAQSFASRLHDINQVYLGLWLKQIFRSKFGPKYMFAIAHFDSFQLYLTTNSGFYDEFWPKIRFILDPNLANIDSSDLSDIAHFVFFPWYLTNLIFHILIDFIL